MMSGRMSKAGLSLCFVYLAITALCVFASLTASGDPKGGFVLLQLPLVLQLAAIDGLGLGSALTNLPWVAAYLLIGLPTLALLYGVGWVLEYLFGGPISCGTSDSP